MFSFFLKLSVVNIVELQVVEPPLGAEYPLRGRY